MLIEQSKMFHDNQTVLNQNSYSINSFLKSDLHRKHSNI